MRYEKRSNAKGESYYSFITSDRRRLTRKEIRDRFGKDILTLDEARDCVKLLSAQFEAEKERIKKRITWEQEFYNFASLLEQYANVQKKRAPNSWHNNVFYLKHYVLYYFLQQSRLNNIDLWPERFEHFKTWLESAKLVKKPKKTIAVSSANHAIKALNTFLDHLYREKIINYSQRCETFPEHLLNTRTIDDVISNEEMDRIYKRLTSGGFLNEALYFRFLYFSGMRFNEGLCISLGDLFQGELESEFLKKKLKAYGIKYHGYIVSDGQFGGLDKAGDVIRLPFKGKRKIEEKHNRVIPVTDKVLWNALVEVAQSKFEGWPSNRSKRDCLLFEGLDDATATRRLQDAFIKERLKWRPWHCLRHSRATWLIGETGDTMLARLWLGHTSPRTIEKYNHIYQAITRAAKAEKTTGKQFGLRKV